MICVDDSEYMRNGDFIPTRMAAVQDAVNIVCLTKTRANPENNVGLLTLASSEVLTTLTTDSAKLMSKMLACKPAGQLQLMSGLRKAHLALKHRQGKNHKMRIVVFVGSPVDNKDAAEWIRLAKRMKKEKVNIDIVAFGDGPSDVLQQFVDTLNGRDGNASHLVVVQQGTSSLTEALMASPVLQSEDGVPMGGGGFDFGIDPNDDPELALALRVSMEEQRTRQEAESRSGAPEAPAPTGSSSEEQMLERALAISREQDAGAAAAGGSKAPAAVDFGSMTEDEQIAYAMQMSMQDSEAAAGGSASAGSSTEAMESEVSETEKMEVDDQQTPSNSEGFTAMMDDPEFIQAVLEGLPAGTKLDKKELEGARRQATEDKTKEEKKEDDGKSGSGSSSAKKSPSSAEKKKTDPKKK